MPRPKRIDRPTRLDICLPESVRGRLDLALYSDVEGRVPHGAYSDLFAQLADKWLTEKGFVG